MPSRLTPPPDFVAPHIQHGRYVFLDACTNRSLALVGAGYEQCGKEFMVNRPSFRWHAVELLERGTWEVLRGGRWVPASAGTVVVYGPSRPGGVRATGTGPHGKYFADFRGTAAARKLRGSGLSSKRVRHLTNPGCTAELYEQLLSCSRLPHQEQSKVAAAILEALLVRIGAEPETPTGLTARRRGAFNRCREYLVANYAILRGPGAAARACRVGPEYFSRLFREHAGQTPSQFLARLRMQHAARLLQQSEVSVKAAGLAVGFDDPYHFSRVFKQIHGVAPRDFQRGSAR